MRIESIKALMLQNMKGHWRLLLLAVATLGMCSCQNPQGNRVAGRPMNAHGQVAGRVSRPAQPYRGQPHAAPLPSPARPATFTHQQQLAAQKQMLQHAAQRQMQMQRMVVQQQLQRPPYNPAPVVPVAFEDPININGAPAEVTSTSHPAPCTSPYCLAHGGTPAHPHRHGKPKYYLSGPDAPNLGGWRDDEFLCDGGDKDVEVVIGRDWAVYGLNLEDTVGHYDTLDGDRIVEPSNKVCIYAPRFAAVRQVRGASLNKQRVKSAGIEQPEQLVQEDDVQIASTRIQQIQPLGELGRSRPVTLEERTRGLTVDNTLLPAEFANRFAAHENFQVIRIGIHQQSEKAVLAEAMEAAAVWETEEAVQVVIDKQNVQVQKGLSAAQELDHFEERGEPKMRVIKVASDKYASPGDEIEFTIRFDNTGDEKIGNVTIIDNLTTRLEYVPDSAQCNIKADFLTQMNEGESLILRWEIIDPLDPGEGGIIRFKCRVR